MELEIGPGPDPGSYVVEVLRSVGGGEPMATFTLDLDELLGRRTQLEDSALSSSVSARRVVSATEAAIQGVGRQLFDSGAGGTHDLFSGPAAALVHSGIHAVAAMQFSISDTAAIEFARGFYAALAHG